MRILISNDDGYLAPGIQVLAAAARRLTQDVWIVAPDGNRSGFGHSISFRSGFEVRRIEERVYACTGTPVDCIIASQAWVLRDQKAPDLVLSGINEGRNIAEDIAYSGTISVAREAAMNGMAALSFSAPRDWHEPDEAGLQCLSGWIASLYASRASWGQDGHWLNINLPHRLPAPLRMARLGRDKVGKHVVIHDESADRARIEPLTERAYASVAGDENSLIANGDAAITRLYWQAQAKMPEGVL